ncbi:MAG: hypothetical protein KJP21_04385 [Bacteroidia bacterium]|nr:hypothetical protein [Bacteroidia bacterium]NNJ56120.1 Crp/Fnr family transcriptional regulator [Bacteroidia bacterium]
MKFIIDQLKNYSPLTNRNTQLIEKQITTRTLSKGEIIRSTEDEPKQIYFIQKGLVKLKLHKKRAVRTHFVHADNTSFIHFGVYHHPNEVFLELKALEDLTIYGIPYNFFEILSFENKELNELYTRMICLDEFIYSHEYSAYKKDNNKDTKKSYTIFKMMQKVAAVFI